MFSQPRINVAPFVLLSALTHGCSAFAAATSSAVELGNLPIEQLMQFEIDSASKHAQKLSDVPAVVSIVTHEDIATYGYRTLADVLNSIRGLYVSYDRNYQYLGVRGFSIAGDYNTRVLMLVDGVRFNDSVYDQAPVGTDFNIDVDLIERVEFVAGPASAVYGSNAIYGVINVVTRNGTDFQGLDIGTEVGSDNASKGRITFGHGTAGGASWLVSLTRANRSGDDLYYREYDTPDQNDGVAEDADYDRSTSLLANYKGRNVSITLTRSERIKGVPTASYGQRFNDNDASTTETRTNLGIEYRNTLAPTLELAARLYGGIGDYQGDYVYDGSIATFINRDESEGRWVGGEIQLGKAFARHHLVGGVEYRRDVRLDQSNFDIAPFVDYFDYRHQAVSKSVYVQDAYSITDKLALDTGVRFDQASHYDWTVNPRLGLIYKPDADTAAKLLYGTAFRTPNAYESSYYPELYRATLGYAVESDLDKERLRSTEIIVEHAFDNSQRIGLSLFHNEIEDLIALDTTADGEFYFANASGARTRGAELEWQAASLHGTRLRVSYSWQQTREIDGGADLANTPRHLFKFNVSGPLLHRWSYGFDARGVSARKTAFDRAAGYVVADLTLRMQLTPGTEISASAYNLLDQEYGDPGSPEHLMDVIEQDGRTFRLKIEHGF